MNLDVTANADARADLPSRWPNRLAWVLACATFPLIWVGGLVTSYDAGMAVPDWPTTFGYNMFLYPWQTWLFGPWDLFVEHGHRLFAALVGMVAIALCGSCWASKTPVWIRWGSMGLLVLVIVQGVLGGIRVRLNSRELAQVHGIVAPLFFAAASALAVMSTPALQRCQRNNANLALGRGTMLLCGLLVVQLVLGSQLRHVDGQMSTSVFRMAVLMHVLMAMVFVVVSSSMTYKAWRSQAAAPFLRHCLTFGLLLIVGQITLGILTWLCRYGWPSGWIATSPLPAWTVQAGGLAQSMIATAHVAMGALLLAVHVSAAVVAWHSPRLAAWSMDRVRSYSELTTS